MVEFQRWLPKRAGSHEQMLPRTRGLSSWLQLTALSVPAGGSVLGGVQAGEGCGQEGGKTTQSQKCMGLESKASLVSAGEGTLFNPQKWLSSWFRALQHMRFPRACQEMGAPQRTVRSSNQGDRLRAALGWWWWGWTEHGQAGPHVYMLLF